MLEATLGILFFTVIVLLLTLFVLGARRLLVPRGECQIEFNGRKTVTAQIGQRLLDVCRESGIALPSACADVARTSIVIARTAK